MFPSILPVLSLAFLLLPASSAPTRTHCRCTILDTSKPWTDSEEPSAPNICSNLGPELENFRHTKPDLYRVYVQQAAKWRPQATPTDDEEKPLTTTVLLQLAAQSGFESLGVVLPSAPTEKPREIIVCRPETEAFSAYQDSRTTLFALHVIVAMAVLACIAESIVLVLDWLERRKQQKPALRLTGSERLLRVYSEVEPIFSPGLEKKLRAYEAPEWVSKKSSEKSSEKREFDAYLVTITEEDDDDEMNRPVM